MEASDALEIVWRELQQNEVPLSDALKLAVDTLEKVYRKDKTAEVSPSNYSDLLCAGRKAKAFDFIQEHATRIHFDDACDSLIYSDKEHFTKDEWLTKAIEKASG